MCECRIYAELNAYAFDSGNHAIRRILQAVYLTRLPSNAKPHMASGQGSYRGTGEYRFEAIVDEIMHFRPPICAYHNTVEEPISL